MRNKTAQNDKYGQGSLCLQYANSPASLNGAGEFVLVLLVNVELPSEVGLDGLADYVNDIGAAHGDMVFETVLADILHQLLQVIHLRHGNATIHAVWVIGDRSLTEIRLDASLRIIGGDAEEGEVTGSDLRIDSTEGIDLA